MHVQSVWDEGCSLNKNKKMYQKTLNYIIPKRALLIAVMG